MTVKQLSVFLENQRGKLLEALKTLSAAEIDLRALSLADTSDFGILRIIVNNPERAFQVLTDAGFLVKSNEVLAVVVGDKPGGLADVVGILAEFGIDIEYTYAFVAHSKDSAYVILRVNNNEAAINVLQKNGTTLLAESAMYSM